MKSFLRLLVLLSIMAWLTAASAQNLSLEQYKNLVSSSDPSWQSAKAAEDGSHLLLNEADSITGIQFYSQAAYMNDNRQTTNPLFMGDRTEYSSYLFGLKQMTDWGAQWTLTQNYVHTHVYDVPTLYLPTPDYYDAYPRLDLSIPLWRNFLGAETSAQIVQTEQGAKLRLKQAQLQRIQKDVEIETAFYSVYSLQQSVAALRDALARAEGVLAWTKSHIARNLADDSDIYQSQAAVTARKMDLSATESQLRIAVQKFNSLRGLDSSELSETLQAPEIDSQQLKLSKSEKRIRRDIALRQYEEVSNEAQYRASKEKHKPQLDLSLSALQNGRDVNPSGASTNTYSQGKDYLQVALTLTVPLNQPQESKFRDGYEALVRSQVLDDEARLNDQRVSWENNVDTGLQLHDQISSAWELEKLQKHKADAERDKFNKGRSTLFQVLTYEQDYLSARSTRINLELQVRQFLSQLSLFE